MAYRCSHECSNCGYEAEISGKLDAVMRGTTIPACCTKCKELSDAVELYTFVEGSLEEKLEMDKKCEHCRKKALEPWDYKKKICPKCDIGKMRAIKKNAMLCD